MKNLKTLVVGIAVLFGAFVFTGCGEVGVVDANDTNDSVVVIENNDTNNTNSIIVVEDPLEESTWRDVIKIDVKSILSDTLLSAKDLSKVGELGNYYSVFYNIQSRHYYTWSPLRRLIAENPKGVNYLAKKFGWMVKYLSITELESIQDKILSLQDKYELVQVNSEELNNTVEAYLYADIYGKKTADLKAEIVALTESYDFEYAMALYRNMFSSVDKNNRYWEETFEVLSKDIELAIQQYVAKPEIEIDVSTPGWVENYGPANTLVTIDIASNEFLKLERVEFEIDVHSRKATVGDLRNCVVRDSHHPNNVFSPLAKRPNMDGYLEFDIKKDPYVFYNFSLQCNVSSEFEDDDTIIVKVKGIMAHTDNKDSAYVFSKAGYKQYMEVED